MSYVNHFYWLEFVVFFCLSRFMSVFEITVCFSVLCFIWYFVRCHFLYTLDIVKCSIYIGFLINPISYLFKSTGSIKKPQNISSKISAETPLLRKHLLRFLKLWNPYFLVSFSKKFPQTFYHQLFPLEKFRIIFVKFFRNFFRCISKVLAFNVFSHAWIFRCLKKN